MKSSIPGAEVVDPSLVHGLVRTARPKQWMKNVLVFAAPGAAGVLDNAADLAATLAAFVAFCLAASGVYFWNDALDVEADRLHPTKRFRPIAAGIVPVTTAKVVGTVLVVLSLGAAAATGRWETVAVVAAYVVLVMLYSAWLKFVAVVDIVTVASGFVLRAAGGAAAVGVPMSNWFVLVTVFGSLFIVAGKRYAELREIGDDAQLVRATLADYSASYLRIVLIVSCGAALLSYCQWAFETSDRTAAEWPFYELSIVPMLTALLRYALVLERGRGAAPEEVFASDRVLQLLGLAWVVLFGLAVYCAMNDGRGRPGPGRRCRGVDERRAGPASVHRRGRLPGRGPDRRDRQLPGPLDDRAGVGGGTRGRGRRDRSARRQRPRPAADRRLRRRGGERPGGVRGQPRPRRCRRPGASRRVASPTPPTATSKTRSMCSTSTAPTATDQPAPTSASGGGG